MNTIVTLEFIYIHSISCTRQCSLTINLKILFWSLFSAAHYKEYNYVYLLIFENTIILLNVNVEKIFSYYQTYQANYFTIIFIELLITKGLSII